MSEVAMRFGPASSARSSPTRESQPALPCVEIASVEVHTDPRGAGAAWRELDAVAAASPYQSPQWLLPWIDTIGAASGVMPLIVVAPAPDRAPRGRIAVAGPASPRRSGPPRVRAGWMRLS